MLDAVLLAFGSSQASTRSELRRAGAITLMLGAVWFAAVFAFMIAQRVWQFLPNEATAAVAILGLPSIVLWCVGTHRLLWGQLAGAPRMNRFMMTGASILAGFCTFALLQVACGLVAGVIVSLLSGRGTH